MEVKKKKVRAWPVILMILFLGIFAVSGYFLIQEIKPYAEEAREHEELIDSVLIAKATERISGGDHDPAYSTEDVLFRTPFPGVTDGPTAEPSGTEEANTDTYGPDYDVDWDKLLRINKEVIGWLYVDAMPEINYPVLKAKNNEKYLHYDLYGKWQKNGCLFVDCDSSSDWSDPNTVIFGHHMKSGAMFGNLEELNSQSKIDANPYFWILTPEGTYCYRIFSVRYINSDSDVYSIFWQDSESFVEWGKTMVRKSLIKTDVEITAEDHVVVLSTCAYINFNRFIVAGVRVDVPGETQEAVPAETPAPTDEN